MNPLTSIRQLWSGATTSLSPTDIKGMGGGSIPTADLRQLNASNLAGSVIGTQPAGTPFAGVLGQMVQDVNAKQHLAGQAMQDLQSGQNVSLHQAMISTEEASVSFQLMVEVRNRLLESYQELMRIQV